MNVWVELQNGTNHTYKNVNRIVERSGKIEMRGGAGGGDEIMVVHDKAQIKNMGYSALPSTLATTQTRSELERRQGLIVGGK